MGLSQDHTVQILFPSESAADRFVGYVERANEAADTSYLRQRGDYKRWQEVETPDWQIEATFDGHRETCYVESNDWTPAGERVILSSCGYGTVPPWIILSAIEQYGAVEMFHSTGPCQGQEDLSYRIHWTPERTEIFRCPDWLDTMR